MTNEIPQNKDPIFTTIRRDKIVGYTEPAFQAFKDIKERAAKRSDRIQPPPGKLTPGQTLFNAVADQGLTFCIQYDGDTDYLGTNPVKAWQALLDCSDPLNIMIMQRSDDGRSYIILDQGVMIIPENGTDDICNYNVGGWADKWCDAHAKMLQELAS